MKGDTQYRTTTIAKAEKFEGYYELTFEDGWSLHVPNPPFAPKPGDEAKIYGKGIGYTVRGLVIDGKTVFYRTEKEQKERDEKEVRDRNDLQKTAYEESKVERTRRIEAMPGPFRERLRGFERRNPDWHKYADYEMFVCEQALIIAESVKTSEGIDAFREMSFEKQMEVVKGLSEDHSGNTFGAACLLAGAYLSDSDIVPKIHGAMCPLVGCREYGCFAVEENTKS